MNYQEALLKAQELSEKENEVFYVVGVDEEKFEVVSQKEATKEQIENNKGFISITTK